MRRRLERDIGTRLIQAVQGHIIQESQNETGVGNVCGDLFGDVDVADV